jgi:hypothetical protein
MFSQQKYRLTVEYKNNTLFQNIAFRSLPLRPNYGSTGADY